MQKHEIELYISEDGEVKIHIKGIKGPGCLKIFDSLANQLGCLKQRSLTREYYETTKDTTSQEIKRRFLR